MRLESAAEYSLPPVEVRLGQLSASCSFIQLGAPTKRYRKKTAVLHCVKRGGKCDVSDQANKVPVGQIGACEEMKLPSKSLKLFNVENMNLDFENVLNLGLTL